MNVGKDLHSEKQLKKIRDKEVNVATMATMRETAINRNGVGNALQG
jgi:hypothetical protein